MIIDQETIRNNQKTCITLNRIRIDSKKQIKTNDNLKTIFFFHGITNVNTAFGFFQIELNVGVNNRREDEWMI